MFVSPCISICKIDAFTGVCIGCSRTSKQITEWTRYTDEQRMNIMKELGYGRRTSTQNRMAREAARSSGRRRGKHRK